MIGVEVYVVDASAASSTDVLEVIMVICTPHRVKIANRFANEIKIVIEVAIKPGFMRLTIVTSFGNDSPLKFDDRFDIAEKVLKSNGNYLNISKHDRTSGKRTTFNARS